MSTGERRLPELDGVRGIAILLVLVGHGFVQHGAGAFAAAGVTLFFVLSGYLITGILVGEHTRHGTIRLRRFYVRRATRLGPPLLVMVASVAVLAWPGWPAVLGATTWTTNYMQLGGLDPAPFSHTWSLAVEEQFYLTWPLLLVVLLGRGRMAVARAVCAVLVVLAMGWRVALIGAGHVDYAYRAFETAGSAIMAGALVALCGWRLRGYWAVVALVGLLASCWAALEWGPAGVSRVMPVLVAPLCVLLVAAAREAAWLAWRPLAACGLASYSLYLWHEPVSYLLGGGWTVVGVLAAVPVGVAAYLLVEAPLMRWRAGVRRPRTATPYCPQRSHQPLP